MIKLTSLQTDIDKLNKEAAYWHYIHLGYTPFIAKQMTKSKLKE